MTSWDRWRCVEAFSSRFCAGIMSLSLLSVPVVAWVYADVRALQKPFGKWRAAAPGAHLAAR